MQVAHLVFCFISLSGSIFFVVGSVVLYFAQLRYPCFLTKYQTPKSIIQYQYLSWNLFLTVSYVI